LMSFTGSKYINGDKKAYYSIHEFSFNK